MRKVRSTGEKYPYVYLIQPFCGLGFDLAEANNTICFNNKEYYSVIAFNKPLPSLVGDSEDKIKWAVLKKYNPLPTSFKQCGFVYGVEYSHKTTEGEKEFYIYNCGLGKREIIKEVSWDEMCVLLREEVFRINKRYETMSKLV